MQRLNLYVRFLVAFWLIWTCHILCLHVCFYVLFLTQHARQLIALKKTRHFDSPCKGMKASSKGVGLVLTGVAQLVGHHPAKWKVTGSVPSWDTCLCCGLSVGLGESLGCGDQTLRITFDLPTPGSAKIGCPTCSSCCKSSSAGSSLFVFLFSTWE